MGYIPVDSELRFTPPAPLNHSGVCLCDLMFGQVQVQVLSGGVTSGSSSATTGGFSPDFEAQIPMRLSFRGSYLSGIYSISFKQPFQCSTKGQRLFIVHILKASHLRSATKYAKKSCIEVPRCCLVLILDFDYLLVLVFIR